MDTHEKDYQEAIVAEAKRLADAIDQQIVDFYIEEANKECFTVKDNVLILLN